MLNLSAFGGLEEEWPVDTAQGQPHYLLVSPKGRYLKLSANAYRLVKLVQAGHSFESLARKVSQGSGRPVSSAEVEEAYRAVEGQILEIADQEEVSLLRGQGFWLRLRLLPAEIVGTIAARLSLAYNPAIAWFFLLFIAGSFTMMLLMASSPALDDASLWPGYALFFFSLLLHELGHASACARYGAAPSEIGLTMYLCFPAFYSDVTAAWRLRRWQRVVVDLGGTYFQFIISGLFAVGYLVYGWGALKSAFFMVLYGALFSLNPVFKFDGYWVLADALGVTNLSKQPGILARHLLDKLSGRQPAPLPWPSWVSLVLFLYAPVVLIVWGYFVWSLVPLLVGATLGYPALVSSLGMALLTEGRVSTAGQLNGFLATTLLLAMGWTGAWVTLRSFLIRPASVWLYRAREGWSQRHSPESSFE